MILTPPDLPPISTQLEGTDTNFSSSVDLLTVSSSSNNNDHNNDLPSPTAMLWDPVLAETLDKNPLVHDEMDPNAITSGIYPMTDDDSSILPTTSSSATTTSSTSSLSTTLILEEVQLDTVNLVLNTLITNNTRFRMRLCKAGAAEKKDSFPARLMECSFAMYGSNLQAINTYGKEQRTLHSTHRRCLLQPLARKIFRLPPQDRHLQLASLNRYFPPHLFSYVVSCRRSGGTLQRQSFLGRVAEHGNSLLVGPVAGELEQLLAEATSLERR